jgi:2-(1,2-epoxy-1,2-dihydrophenyl)acetyl-CoA isomerase
LTSVQAVAEAIVSLSKPVMAVVHGWTVGAGLEWMLNADVVIASSSARFKLPEASLGVFVTGGLIATLPAYAGVARAKALMLLGEEFSANDAQSWGLIWRVVEPEALESESARVAQKLVSLQPEVAARFKRALNEVGLHNFSRAIEIENEVQRTVGTSESNTAVR